MGGDQSITVAGGARVRIRQAKAWQARNVTTASLRVPILYLTSYRFAAR